MVRLLSPSGSVVNVSDEKAARLGWPRYGDDSPAAAAPAAAKKAAPAKKAAAKKAAPPAPTEPETGVLSTSDLPVGKGA